MHTGIINLIFLIALTSLFNPGPASYAGTANQPRKISIGWPQPPKSWDPRITGNGPDQQLTSLIHCSLISLGKTGSLMGDLAEHWTWENSLTLTFVLKDGVKYSDGAPVTPGDVKSTFDSVLSAKAPFSENPLRHAGRIKSIRISDRSVTFELTGPDSAILADLTLGIMPGSMLSSGDINQNTPVRGCGPFKIESESKSSLVLVRNPFYSLESTTLSPGIRFKFSSSEQASLEDLELGNIDVLFGAEGLDKVLMFSKGHPGIRIEKYTEFSTRYLGYNLSDAHLADIRIRKAVALAIDRTAIIKHRLHGFAVPARSLLIPNHPYLNDKLHELRLDREAANRLLDEAGLRKRDSSGFRFRINVKTLLDPLSIEIAKAIAADLAKIGISANVEALEPSNLHAAAIAGNLQLWVMTKGDLDDPSAFQDEFGANGKDDSISRWGRYNNPEVDKLLKLALSETIPAGRKLLYDRVQDLIGSDLPALFLWHEERAVLMREKVNGIDLRADGSLLSLLKVTLRTSVP